MKKNILYLFFSITFFSCDPSTQTIFKIDNRTGVPVQIDFEVNDEKSKLQHYENLETTIIITANTSTYIIDFFEMENTSDYGSDFLKFFKSIKISNVDSTEINLQYRNREAWKHKVIKSSLTSKVIEYKLVIEE